MFLANAGDQELQLGWGTTVMGFGKGKWKKAEEGNLDSDKHILFELKSQNDLAVFDGKLQPIRNIMGERRKTNPAATVMYHEMKDQAALGWGTT